MRYLTGEHREEAADDASQGSASPSLAPHVPGRMVAHGPGPDVVHAQQGRWLRVFPVLDPGRGETGRDPFHEGLRARVQGLSWADCPYPPGTYRRCDWLDGWDEEDALSPRMAKAGRRR